MFFEGKVTCDHQVIQQWVSAKGGWPAVFAQPAGFERLHICFPGCHDQDIARPIPWDTFFEAFDRQQLAFLYREDESLANLHQTWQML